MRMLKTQLLALLPIVSMLCSVVSSSSSRRRRQAVAQLVTAVL
jgi:hypothetical protein